MWAQQTGTSVDGVVAIDPVALSYVLGATGPVTMPDGEVVTKDNVVELTESTAYVKLSDGPARPQTVSYRTSQARSSRRSPGQ